MAKPTPISGFPEWLPEQRLVELHALDTLRARFESFGFAPLETRAVEPLDQLLAKGETDQEIYVLRRLHAADDEGDAGLGLHFDLTVPFARYVAQNRGRLAFPFKRWQIQKVWRGERPQVGRYREFYQADLDVVAEETLALDFDAEMARLLVESMSALPVPPVTLGINNRKVLQGAYAALGIDDVPGTLRIVDKLDKVGERGVLDLLVERAGLAPQVAEACVAIGRIRTADASFADAVRALVPANALLDAGLDELTRVIDALADLPAGSVVANLSIARGLDYYTGTVYEGQLRGHENLGTVCSGGRYDDLVGGGGAKLPGVGVSIGVTRILGRFLGDGLLRATRSVPTCVLVTLPSDEARPAARAAANALRARGIATEVFHEAARFGKQMKYADRRGIPFAWFPPADPSAPHEVKDLRTGAQTPADPASWTPPADDLRPRVVPAE